MTGHRQGAVAESLMRSGSGRHMQDSGELGTGMAADVRVQPVGAVLVPDDDESIFHCALRAGYRWPTVCGGVGTCRSCFMMVTEGEELLEPVGPWEQEGIDAIGARPGTPGVVRLACQARVRAGVDGHVVVDKRGVRPAKPAG